MEICKVRRDAVGSNTKAYTHAVIVRNGRKSTCVIVLDANFSRCGTFNVNPNFLWKLKATVRRPLERKLAQEDARIRTLVQAFESELKVKVKQTPEAARFLTHVQVCEPPKLLDGLKCVQEVTLNNKSTNLTIAYDGVTNCTTGAIVNAANEGCLGGGGIDGRICDLGGPALDAARRALPTIDGSPFGPRCKTGDAKITIAGNLPCDKVIHAVGPVFGHTPPFDASLSLLADAYKSALTLARAEGLTKVAFCIISAGIFRGSCPLDNIIKTGITAIAANVYPELERVYFCAFTPQEQAITHRVICELEK